MSDRDAGETRRLRDAVARVLPALELFIRYEGEDRAGRDRDTWRSALDRPLSDHGIGLESLLKELATTVIPYGLRNGAPGFSGWITTSPTTGPAVAAFAAAIAGRSAGGFNPSTSSKQWGYAGSRNSWGYQVHGRERSAAAARRRTLLLSERPVSMRSSGWGSIQRATVSPARRVGGAMPPARATTSEHPPAPALGSGAPADRTMRPAPAGA